MRRLLLLLLLCAGCGHAPPPARTELAVAAAANLTDVFGEIARQFETRSGVRVVYSFGSTAQLARQIEQAAPFDVFAAADTEHVEQLDHAGLLVPGTRAVYARGKLALWVPPGSTLTIRRLEDVAKPEVRALAIARPEAAPYGRAAVESLQSLGIWQKVQPKIVYAENISMTKQYAATHNADAALTAYSLVFRSGGTVLLVEERLHHPIEQALAVVRRSTRQDAARQFTRFVRGADGEAILQRYGYERP
jgi:molybdate transport system substrate-binding protein